MMRRNAVGHAQHYAQIFRLDTLNINDDDSFCPSPKTSPARSRTPIDPASLIRSALTRRLRHALPPNSVHRYGTSQPPNPTSLASNTQSTRKPDDTKLTNLPRPQSTTTAPPPSASNPSTHTTTTTNPNPNLNSTNTSPRPTHASTHSTGPTSGNEASTKLAEALDDFLGDVERKFKGISEEILARLDEMAERCDRLEGELLRGQTTGRPVVAGAASTSTEGKGSV